MAKNEQDPSLIENEDHFEAEQDESAAAQIETLEAELKDSKEQLLRRTAEMDNMRRRFAQEREQLIFEANKRLIADLLSTVDDLERTLDHAGAEKGALYEGVQLVHKNFLKTLERYGVKAMETVGKPFDVHSQDALMQESAADVEPGTVTKEIQKGYKMNDSVLRHAKVVVASE